MLSFSLHTHRESEDLLLPCMGHIVIHHRCRSRLVGGAEALSGCGTTYSNSVSVFQANEIANPEIEPDADCGSGGAKPSSSRLRRSPSAARRFGAEFVRTRWLGECRSGQKKTSRRDWFRRKPAVADRDLGRLNWAGLQTSSSRAGTAGSPRKARIDPGPTERCNGGTWAIHPRPYFGSARGRLFRAELGKWPPPALAPLKPDRARRTAPSSRR